MSIETAEQAAQAFVEGRWSDCRAWCFEAKNGDDRIEMANEAATRTAAVALELGKSPIGEQEQNEAICRLMDFLRMMAGAD